jgi:RES domain-containing protein
VRHADLVGALGRVPGLAVSGLAYRHVAEQRSALSGEGARITGGRWNPQGSFAVLYLGMSRTVVLAEFERLAHRQGLAVTSFLPRVFYTYEVVLERVLDLRVPAVLDTTHLDEEALRADDPSRCQAVGEAAHVGGFEAILAPSATGRGDVLAVFVGAMSARSTVRVVNHERWESAPPEE